MIKGINIDSETADNITVAALTDSLKNLYEEYKESVVDISADPQDKLAIDQANEAALYFNAHLVVLDYFTTKEKFEQIVRDLKKFD